jgi:hypothetical protein
MSAFLSAKSQAVIFHMLSRSSCWQAECSDCLKQPAPAGRFLLNLVLAWYPELILLLAYRLYALWTASYSLERDGVHLRWGFRSEDVPIDAVLWVRTDENLGMRLALPFFRWPGESWVSATCRNSRPVVVWLSIWLIERISLS